MHPRPQVVSQPPTKKDRRRFKGQWQVSHSCLQYANAAMSCIACKEYPQLSVQQSWPTRNAQLCKQTVVQHNNCGVHCKFPRLC